MKRFARWYAAVQAISIARLGAAVLFSAIAFQPYPVWLIVGIYLIAAFSDFIDGLIARRVGVATFTGKVIDLISDKSLTAVSLLYAAAHGVPIFPLAIIAARELLSLGLRIVEVHGSQLLPTSKWFGGAMAFLLWGNTALLVLHGSDPKTFSLISLTYWFCAAVFGANLTWRLFKSRKRIRSALAMESEQGQRSHKA